MPTGQLLSSPLLLHFTYTRSMNTYTYLNTLSKRNNNMLITIVSKVYRHTLASPQPSPRLTIHIIQTCTFPPRHNPSTLIRFQPGH